MTQSTRRNREKVNVHCSCQGSRRFDFIYYISSMTCYSVHIILTYTQYVWPPAFLHSSLSWIWQFSMSITRQQSDFIKHCWCVAFDLLINYFYLESNKVSLPPVATSPLLVSNQTSPLGRGDILAIATLPPIQRTASTPCRPLVSPSNSSQIDTT